MAGYVEKYEMMSWNHELIGGAHGNSLTRFFIILKSGKTRVIFFTD